MQETFSVNLKNTNHKLVRLKSERNQIHWLLTLGTDSIRELDEYESDFVESVYERFTNAT